VRPWPGRRLRSLRANAALSVRIMVAATVLVMVTLVVMGALGTAMLRSFCRMNTRVTLDTAMPPRITMISPTRLR